MINKEGFILFLYKFIRERGNIYGCKIVRNFKGQKLAGILSLKICWL